MTTKSRQKAKFRPLQSLSNAFTRRKRKKTSTDSEEEDDSDDEYSSDDSDDAYYNPDGAEDDWDMCDPDERARNIFVAEVTKRKYKQGIINYEEMCHMLKIIGAKPPPKDGTGLTINEQVEKSAKEKYAKGIISYSECCHLLRVIGVTNFPKRKSKETEDEEKTDDGDKIEGDTLSGVPMGQISPSRFSRKIKPRIPSTVMPVTPLSPVVRFIFP
jgi:hypothetical protein